MNIKQINSYQELKQSIQLQKKAYLLLYKSGSEQGECALNNYNTGAGMAEGLTLLAADVNLVRDIHPAYGITSVPATPTCSWCTTLKSYLRKNNIPFSDVDVSWNQCS